MDGYIRLHRKLLENKIFNNERLLKVWVWCLLRASYTTRTVILGRQEINILPGQFITGQLRASDELKMPKSTVWDCLKLLVKLGYIDMKSGNKFSVVTVINWGLYQSPDGESGSKSVTDGEQTGTNNKGKKGKKKDIEDDGIPYSDIIACLNKNTGQDYRVTSEKTRSLIRARIGEGYTPEDLMNVIKDKAAAWGKDPKMRQYLRPETLFGKTKFEGYIQQARALKNTQRVKQIGTINIDPERFRK